MYDKIYLDNNATTMIDSEVLAAMLPHLKEEFGNPSSIYNFGKTSKIAIENSRKIIADHINANSNEIVFTSCASESNVTAIMSAVKNNLNKKHIITTKVEHSSILESLKYLASIGYNITYLKVDEYGKIDIEELKRSITDDTFLITIMLANNEIGNIYPIKQISKIIGSRNILFHVDGVQAVGKINIDIKSLGVDSLSISGHKIHAPKGIGILYVKSDIPFTPLIFGHQENDKRGGTENVAYIAGIGKAFEILDVDKENLKLEKLRNNLEEQIINNIDDTVIYGDQENRLPNVINIAFKGVKGEELLLMLESNNIYVSTGSACNSFDISPSHVLVAMGIKLENSSPIRISLSKYTTEAELEIFIKKLINIVNMLRKRGK